VLDARITRRLGSLSLDLELVAASGETLVLIGENGAGKTTALRLLAGLERLDSGRIALDGAVLDEPSSGTFVAPHDRRVGWVPQELALFPHLSVAENVAFGLRAHGLPAAMVRKRTDETLERLAIAALADRPPGELSGGQRQRVSLARALAPEPALLLLDEPLASLDARSRREVRLELGRLLATLPCATVLVTHSPQDAIALGQSVVLLEAGRAVARGTPESLLQTPATPHLAAMVAEEPLDESTRSR